MLITTAGADSEGSAEFAFARPVGSGQTLAFFFGAGVGDGFHARAFHGAGNISSRRADARIVQKIDSRRVWGHNKRVKETPTYLIVMVCAMAAGMVFLGADALFNWNAPRRAEFNNLAARVKHLETRADWMLDRIEDYQQQVAALSSPAVLKSHDEAIRELGTIAAWQSLSISNLHNGFDEIDEELEKHREALRVVGARLATPASSTRTTSTTRPAIRR